MSDQTNEDWNNPDFVRGNRAAEERECQAIREGYKAEICAKCNTVFLAHKHMVMCQKNRCPMKSRNKSVLEQITEPGSR